jgi:hypothetical protein
MERERKRTGFLGCGKKVCCSAAPAASGGDGAARPTGKRRLINTT